MLKVSNLPVSTTKSDLEKLFSDYGKIQIIGIDIENDESIAYVQLDNDEDEKDAIEKLDKSEWRGKYIYVDTFRGELTGRGQPPSGGNQNTDTKKN
ncbi:RNA-binding protein [Nostoc sp. CHAB 5836]|uniref:RNA recognition motif domain-containing protein n=1 Tax=Nostoc sp. CHAB 5836 TaxID=2780404 RepID=UPI001E30B5DC|nr:RNA-binding protein [Nostoc sp. CHAB 5836]MCC5617842.1 RNA-binding protein [Nostoc sp. CHAB 5836]